MDATLTQEAIINEMKYFNEQVWEFMSMEEARRKSPDGTYIGGRWVMCSKGDDLTAKIRCKFVGTEVNRENDLAYYASTSPPP